MTNPPKRVTENLSLSIVDMFDFWTVLIYLILSLIILINLSFGPKFRENLRLLSWKLFESIFSKKDIPFKETIRRSLFMGFTLMSLILVIYFNGAFKTDLTVNKEAEAINNLVDVLRSDKQLLWIKGLTITNQFILASENTVYGKLIKKAKKRDPGLVNTLLDLEMITIYKLFSKLKNGAFMSNAYITESARIFTCNQDSKIYVGREHFLSNMLTTIVSKNSSQTVRNRIIEG